MSPVKFRLVAFLGTICLLVLLFVVWQAAGSVAANGPDGGSTSETGSAKQAALGNPAEPGRALREPVKTSGEAGRLALVVRKKGGKRVAGKLYVSFTRWARRTSSLMAPEQGYDLPRGRVDQRSHDGTAEVRVPRDHWTWLRATGAGLSGYLRIPPFSGRKKVEILLDGKSRALHVFLLESDFVSPAAHREVRVFGTSMTGGVAPTLLETVKTDALGYACIRDLKPQGFLVCAPFAKPGDLPPHVERVILTEQLPIQELPITLVIPKKLRRVQFKVSAIFEAKTGPAPKLFLEAYLRSGARYPMPGVLRPGKQGFELKLPPGEFHVRILPVGELRVAHGSESIKVEEKDEQSFELELYENTHMVSVELLGIKKSLFPVIVYPQAKDKIVGGDPRLVYFGPYRWYENKQKVKTPDYAGRLLANDRYRSWWISSQEHRFDAGSLKVAMEAATHVQVHWHGQAIFANKGALLEVKTRFGTQFVYLQARLIRKQNGLSLPTLVGDVVVPRGKLRFTGLMGMGKSSVWTRELVADNSFQRVEVEY